MKKLKNLTKKQIITIITVMIIIIAIIIAIIVFFRPNPLKGRWKCNQNNITFEMRNGSFEFYQNNRESLYQKGQVKVTGEGREYKIFLTIKRITENGIKTKANKKVEYTVEKTDIDKIILTNSTTNAKYSCELE